MPRSIWKGAVSFGLVSIPVALFTATENKTPKFKMLRAEDGSPIKYKRVAEADGEEVSWEAIDRAVRATVDENLESKGFSQRDGAAYEVYYFVGADEVNQISSHYGGHYYGVTWTYWGWERGPGAYAQDARIYDQGSLTLDVVDAGSGVLVWRGTATATIDPNALPKERRKSLEKIVARMLADFPPR